MTCHEARELFSADVDEALAPEDRAAVAAHLAGCVDCRRELARFRATVALLRAAEPIRAPVGFVDRVLEAARPVPWHERLRRRLFSPVALRRPIEVTVVALVALTAVYLYERTPEVRQAARSDAPARPLGEVLQRQAQEPPPARDAPAPAAAPKPVAPKKERAPETREYARQEAPAASGLAPEPAQEAERKTAAVEEKRAEAERGRVAGLTAKSAAPAAAPSVAGSLSAPDVVGTLAVSDRNAARQALSALMARVGGREVAGSKDAASETVELVLPASAYPQLVAGLAGIGRWEASRQPAELPAQVRVSLVLTD